MNEKNNCFGCQTLEIFNPILHIVRIENAGYLKKARIIPEVHLTLFH
jgi:hypothetical protein